MRFRFIGRYTGKRTTINACGVVFEMHEPAEVSEPEAIRRLSGHPEFEAVEPDDAPAPAPKKRGRPRKAD
jgi:hypothetical protein